MLALPTKGLARWLFSHILFSERQYCYRWPEKLIADLPLPEGVEFRQITRENVRLVREWKGRIYTRYLHSLLARDQIGVFALKDGQVVGVLWASVRVKQWSPATLHSLLDVGEAISGRAETRPEFRRQGVAQHLHAELQQLLRRVYGERVHTIWGLTGTRNLVMQTLATRMGCVRCYEEHILVLLRHLFFHCRWALEPDTGRRLRPRRLSLRLRVPTVLFWLRPCRRRLLGTG